MPTFSGGPDAKFTITFCKVGGGTGTLLVSLDDDADQPAGSNHFEQQNCPFGIVVAKAAMPAPQGGLLALASAGHPILPAVDRQSLPPRPALGPPLGPRAPPSNLG